MWHATPRLLVAVVLGGVLANATLAAADKPNLVCFLADDHGIHDSTPYGGQDVETPHLQRLADRGLRFTRAYVASPACGPSRACLLAGRMPAGTGVYYNHQRPRADLPSLIPVLTAAGYEVVSIGKVAHGRPSDAAWWGLTQLEGEIKAGFPTRELERFLAQREPDRPLCLFVGSTATHVPWPEETATGDNTVTLPPTHFDTPATRRQRNHYLQSVRVTDQHLGETLRLADEYLGEDRLTIYTSDHGAQWPFGKWTLYEAGVRVPMLATWPGVIEPGRVTDAMVSWIDLLPTLIELAGSDVPEDVEGRSFAAVLRGGSDSHREAIYTFQNGDSRVSHHPSRAVRVGDLKYLRNLRPEWAFTTHIDQIPGRAGEAYLSTWIAASKTDDQAARIVRRYYARPAEELYDLATDPNELTNLAADPEYTERLQGLRDRLNAWLDKQGDDGLIDLERPVRLLSNPIDWAPAWAHDEPDRWPTDAPPR